MLSRLPPVLRVVVRALAAALVLTNPAAALVKETRLVEMTDGVRLATDIYRPDGAGPWPVLLMRTVYSRNAPNVARDAEGRTKDGWVLVVQDTRGRFDSEGANHAFEADGWAAHHDGADTLAWIGRQPWSNGQVATGGASALGITQLLLAGSGVQPIATQHIVVATPSLYDAAYRQGVFRRATIEDWLKASAFGPEMLRLWTAHSRYDSYWERRNLDGRYEQIRTPALHYGGWFDIFAQGTLDSFRGYNEQGGRGAKGKQHLLMGPWTHGVGGAKAGELVFPGANKAPTKARHLGDWINHAVKGAANGIASEPSVIYYVMGDTSDPQAPGNFWRGTDRWPRPDAQPTPFFFHPDHSLSAQAPAADGKLTYVHDPANPVPTVGGPWLTIPAGPMNQAAIETRSDVLVFTSEPLPAPMEITGRISARLWISSDAPDTDFFVRLCIVGADGRSYNLAEGAVRARFWKSLREENLLQPGQVYPLTIDLWSTSVVFNTGNRLRVQVASSSAPGYEVNPNNGLPLKAPGEPRPARNTLHLGPEHPSQVILPVAPFRPDAYPGGQP